MARTELAPNQERHRDNLHHLHGFFYHGIYYKEGVAQISNEKMVKIENKRNGDNGTLYQHEKNDLLYRP